MKKTLLAAATLMAVSGTALAQSSVTLYGLVDLSLESVKAGSNKSLTRISTDNYASSRLGFKGVEDLGGGLKANFLIETGIKVDTGAQNNSARFWDRSAWVGASGGFGEIRLGRIDSSIGFLAGNSNILGAQQGYDDLKIAGTWGADKYRRIDNAITYYIPKFVDGLTAQIQYTTAAGSSATPGTETAGDKTGRGFSLNAQYVIGPFAAGAAYLNINRNTTGSVEDSAALAYASYDFGVAKAIGYYNVDSANGISGTGVKKKEVLGLKAVVPFSKDFTAMASFARVRNAANSAAKDDATIISLKGMYSLSKRTGLYALLTTIDNEAGSALNVVGNGGSGGTAGKNSHGIAVGVRHAF